MEIGNMMNVAVVGIWVVIGFWFAIAAWADRFEVRRAVAAVAVR
jgi:hypothetical protein